MSSRAEKYFESTVKEQSGWQAIMNVFKTLWKVFVAIFMRLEACAKAWVVSLCLTKHISRVGNHVRNETHLMLEYIEYSSNVDHNTRFCAIRL